MNLVPNAQKIINEEFAKNEFRALQISVRERAENNHKTIFIQSMQALFTKLGLVVSKVVKEPKIITNTYLGSINYLTRKILVGSNLYKVLESTNVNQGGNKIKHSLDEIEAIDMDTIIILYNHVCDLLSKKLGISFNQAKVQKFKKKENKSLFAEDKYEKYDSIVGIKIKTHLTKDCTINRYTKMGSTKIEIEVQDMKRDRHIQVEVFSLKNKKRLTMGSIKSSEANKTLNVSFSEDDLYDNNYLKVEVKYTVYQSYKKTKTKEVKKSYTTGILFWKKEKYYTEPEKITVDATKVIGTKTIVLESRLEVR